MAGVCDKLCCLIPLTPTTNVFLASGCMFPLQRSGFGWAFRFVSFFPSSLHLTYIRIAVAALLSEDGTKTSCKLNPQY